MEKVSEHREVTIVNCGYVYIYLKKKKISIYCLTPK